MRFKIQIVISPWREIEKRVWVGEAKKGNPIRFPSHTQEGSDTKEKYGINFLLRRERKKSTLEYKMIS